MDYYENEFIKACRTGNQEQVKKLYEELNDEFTINALSREKYTALAVASEAGNVETVRFLLEKRINIETKNIFGETALHLASKYGDIEIAEILINHGANMEEITNEGDTPLVIASYSCEYKFLKYIIHKGANIRVVDNDGKSFLDYISSHKKKKEFEKIIFELDSGLIKG